MKHNKCVAEPHHRNVSLIAHIFARAARASTALTVLVCAMEFLAMAILFHDASVLPVGFAIVGRMPVIWVSTLVLVAVLLVSRSLSTRKQGAAIGPRRWIGVWPSVWDEWLDGPSRT